MMAEERHVTDAGRRGDVANRDLIQRFPLEQVEQRTTQRRAGAYGARILRGGEVGPKDLVDHYGAVKRPALRRTSAGTSPIRCVCASPASRRTHRGLVTHAGSHRAPWRLPAPARR